MIERQTHLAGEFCVESFFDGHKFGVITSSTAIGDFDVDSCHSIKTVFVHQLCEDTSLSWTRFIQIDCEQRIQNMR
jgi:hypothetical protein